MGIGLFCCAFGIGASTATDTDKETEKFKELPVAERMGVFDELVCEGRIHSLDQAVTMEFLNSLSLQERTQKTLELYQQTFNEMPPALAVYCISSLPNEDKELYSERLLREKDVSDEKWWSTFYTSGVDGSEHIQCRTGKKNEKWLGSELLKNFSSERKRAELALMLLEKHWDTFSPDAIACCVEHLFLEEQQVGYLKRLLETKAHPNAHESYRSVHSALKLISVKKRDELVLELFETSFERMPLDLLCCLLENVSKDVDKERYGVRVLLSKAVSNDHHYEANNTVRRVLHALFPKPAKSDDSKEGEQEARKLEFTLSFLKEHFHCLEKDVLFSFISQISSLPKKLLYLKQLIATKKLTGKDQGKIKFLGRKESTPVLLMLLDAFFEQLSTDDCLELISRIDHQEDWKAKYLSVVFEEPRKKYIRRLIAREDLFFFKSSLEKLSPDEKYYVASTLLNKKLHTIDNDQAFMLIDFLPQEEKEAWLQKNSFFWALCSGNQEAVGPLFSKEFLLKNSEEIISILACSSLVGEKIKHIQKMMLEFVRFMKQQYKQGKIVLLHGQHDKWAFLGDLFDALVTIKCGHPLPRDFVRLRFQIKPVLTPDEVRATREKGIPELETFKDIWFHLLFTNLHLLANDRGSNSLLYFLENYDQTTETGRFDFDAGIKRLFAELDMLPEYETVMKDQPTLFTDLYDLYKKDVVARGDIGTLVAIAMLPSVAQRLAYSTISGGPLRPLVIDGKSTVDVGEIASKFGQAPFNQEFAAIMAEEITDPYKAAEVGVTMAGFIADSNEESVPLAYMFKNSFTDAQKLIARLLHQRQEHARAFRKSCPFALSYNNLALVGAAQKKQ